MLRLLRGFVIDLLGVLTAALLLPVVTLGQIKVDIDGHAERVRWHGVEAGPDGTLLVGRRTAAVAGLVFWAVVAGLGAVYLTL